jgi:transposase
MREPRVAGEARVRWDEKADLLGAWYILGPQETSWAKSPERRSTMSSNIDFSAIGMDLGDKYCVLRGLDQEGEVVMGKRVKSAPHDIQKLFSKIQPTLVAMEAGSMSGWISRVVKDCGHEVIVSNPRKVRAISQNEKKCDGADAEMLGRLARADPKLLFPIQHRGEQAQADLSVIRSRDLLVRTRTSLISHVRSILKGFGVRPPRCSSDAFHHRVAEYIPEALLPALEPVVGQLRSLTATIRAYEKYIDRVAGNRYPETKYVAQVVGVGTLTALAFILTIEDPSRFRKSRSVGPFCGLCPRSSRSCESNPQLRISKTGNDYLRRLLVNCGHYILGPFGPPCYLREWGLTLMQRGGKNAKKRAAVAVARRLAVLLLRLWITGEKYDAFRNSKTEAPQGADEAA